MRRAIKFRAWLKDEDDVRKMISGECFTFEEYAPLCDALIKGNDEQKIMQSTGLQDKNGIEIYEGDIFKFTDEVWTSSYTSCGTEYDSFKVTNYAVVGFDEETIRYDFVQYKYGENQVEADLHENHDIEFADFIQEHEVVGNIYENPELLSEVENGTEAD